MPFSFISKDNFHLKEILKLSNANFLIRILSRLVGYVGVLLLVKIYGVELYGQWTISFGIFVFVRSVFSLGIRFSFVKYFATTEYNRKELYKKGLSMLLFSTTISAVLLYLFASKLGEYMDKDFFEHSLKLMALAIVPASITEFHAGILRGIKEILHYSVLELAARPLIILSIACLCYFMTNDFSQIYLYYLIGELILVFLSIILLYRKFPRVESSSLSISRMEILKLSFPMFLTGSFNVLMKWADVLLLGFFVSDSVAGIYNIVVRLTNLVLLPFQSINSIFSPKLRQTFVKEGMANVNQLFKVSRKLTASVSLLPLVAFFVAGQFILEIFEITVFEAFMALIILATAQYFNAFVGSVGQVLNMLDQHNYLMNLSLIVLLLNIGLNFSLIPHFEIYGAAISTFVSIVVLNYFAFKKVKGRLEIRLFNFN